MTWPPDATYSEGFRPGGINRIGPVGPYKSDYLTNYELGWKTMWGGSRLRLYGAVFHEGWDDVQYSFLPPSGAGLTVIKNAGSAEIDGIEMDLTWAATDSLLVSGGLTWLDSQLTKDSVPDPDEPPAALEGDSLPITPDFKANVTARSSFQVGEYDSYLQGALVYNGSSYSDLPRAEREAFGEQDAYTIVDLSAGVTRGDYSLTLFINNVFDELARTYTYAQCTVSVCGGNPYYLPTLPLTIGLKFSQEF